MKYTMSHTVTLGEETRFHASSHETVLSAATRQNLNLPHSCKNGICGQCKADLISGEMTMSEHSAKALPAQEKLQGKILLCCTTAQSDLTIRIDGYNPHAQTVKILPARIEYIRIQHNVAILRLGLPKSSTFSFSAGQYIDLLLPGNHVRSYSIANAPNQGGFIELHIRYRKQGVCSNMIFGQPAVLKEKGIVRIKGPLGTFGLKKDSAKPIIFLATGTGFAPIRSMLAELIRQQNQRTVHLYWGAHEMNDLYALSEAQDYLSRLNHSYFTPVLRAPTPDWQGDYGYVQDIVAHDYPDLSGYEVYACGAPAMVEHAFSLFTTQCRLPKDAFYSDAFTQAV